jgi:XTP/dITP diphosphohydrolase
MIDSLVIASHNQGKWQEIQAVLAPLSIQILSLNDFKKSSPIEEIGLSFIENAILKARHIAKLTGLPALGDDSGLVVTALNGEPGLYSARYAGTPCDDQNNIEKLLQELSQHKQRDAFFYCAMALCRDALDPCPIICQARWHGQILSQTQGKQGFGYDPIFYVPTHHCSAAELAPAEKNRISHRGLALHQLIVQLQNENT